MITNKSTTEEIAEGLKEFAKWAKEHGYDISLEPSLNPDTFEKLFGSESEKEVENDSN